MDFLNQGLKLEINLIKLLQEKTKENAEEWVAGPEHVIYTELNYARKMVKNHLVHLLK